MPQGVLAARTVGAVLAGLWGTLAAAVLIAYRPGGPADPVVGLAAFVPCAVAAATVAWPPHDEDGRLGAAMVWLGILSALLVAPLLAGVLEVLTAGGRQTLLPSLEVAYAAALALVTTCLYGALGISRRWLPGDQPGTRTRLGVAMGVGMTLLGGAVFGAAALANEQALRDRPVTASAWGPTDPSARPPLCNEPARLGPGATVDLVATATIDLQPAGQATVTGARQGSDESWTAELEGRFGAGSMSWTRIGGQGWLAFGDEAPELVAAGHFDPGRSVGGTLDGPVLDATRGTGAVPVAEELGLDLFDGAPARHCRRAIDGPTALDAVLALRWLAAQPLTQSSTSLEAWRGEIDWWVFADGQLGRAVITVSGYPGDAWQTSGIAATLEATMTALHRAEPHVIVPPPAAGP